MKYLYILTLLLISVVAKGQYTMFAEEGIVTYDKTIYMKNIMRKQFIEKADEAQKANFQNMLPRIPETIVLKKTLTFKGDETLFEPVKQDIDPITKQMLMLIDYDASTLSNLKTHEYLRYNDMIGQKVIIQDSVKKVNWKITDEYREIAGYNCRRANGITSDSTYVIGYYCNEIPLDGGPESISGLPGLILGLVVPSQHVSYFATQVDIKSNLVFDKKVFENTKIKRMSRREIAKMMSESFGNFLNKPTVDYIIKLSLM